MIIGDTRCGKGNTVEGLFKYFGVGEVISADNASFAGLVGGMDKINDHWVVRWGKFSMNDLGILAIDEASEIKKEDWTRLSRIRSEGIAEIAKIQARITNARTRQIYISNPPKKIIANYSYGIQALVDVVESPEDIARFDYCLVVSHDEVSIADINTPQPKIAPMYSAELERKLIMWVWSRKHDEIKFSEDAEKLLYERAIKLASIFDFSIPLIQGENVRIKLAKIAVAFAGRVYSNKNYGQFLYVTSVHVECAYYFLRLIYRKDECGYLTYSQIRKSSEKTDFTKIESYFDSFIRSGGGENVKKCLLLNTNITISDLMEYLNLPREVAVELISKLLKYGCIVKKYSHYVKTPAFNVWLKKEIMNN